MTTTMTPTATAPTAVAPTATPAVPAPIPGPVLQLWERAQLCLHHARAEQIAADRYTNAHLAALRGGAALLAARSIPGQRSRPRSVWEVLPQVVPEFADWAVFYAGTGQRRLQVEQGSAEVSSAEADELITQVECFLGLVGEALGLPRQLLHPRLFAHTYR